MQVEDLEFALREAAANQPPVSPTARRDVVRRARQRWAAEGLALLIVVAGLGGLALNANQGGKRGMHVTTRPGPPTSVKVGPTPTTSPLLGVGTTVRPTVPTTPAGATVPARFTAGSITFVSRTEGWVLGWGDCPGGPPQCPAVLLRTDDAGRTWTRIPAPPTLTPGNANGGAAQVRFANARDGWVYGPDMWVTHDGGSHWTRLPLGGAPVMALEVGAGVVHAALQDPGNPSIRIETSPVSSDDWQLSPTALQLGAGPVPDVQIVLQGRSGWIVENDRVVIAGAHLVNGAWLPWQPPCLTLGGPASLAAPDPTHVVVLCDQGLWNGASPGVHTYTSADGGATFTVSSVLVPVSGGVGPVASPAAATIVTATVSPATGFGQIIASFDSGARWQTVQDKSGPRLIYLGFTTAMQGVAIDGAGRLLMTFDGGHRWAPVNFTNK
jgi:hypothetical protein